MKHPSLLLILFLATLSSFCQANDDKDFLLLTYDSKPIREHKIDSITVTFIFPNKQFNRLYLFDTSGNLTNTVTFDEEGKKTSESFLVYNRKGQLTSKTDRENTLDRNTLYYYNQSGQGSKTLLINKKIDTTIFNFRYDGRNLVEEERLAGKNGMVSKYKYNSEGKLTNVTTFVHNDRDTVKNILLEKMITYDNRGNKLTEELSYVFMKYTYNYKYDDQNKLVQVQKDQNTENYYYDERGLINKKVITEWLVNSPLNYTEQYKYSFRKK